MDAQTTLYEPKNGLKRRAPKKEPGNNPRKKRLLKNNKTSQIPGENHRKPDREKTPEFHKRITRRNTQRKTKQSPNTRQTARQKEDNTQGNKQDTRQEKRQANRNTNNRQ